MKYEYLKSDQGGGNTVRKDYKAEVNVLRRRMFGHVMRENSLDKSVMTGMGEAPEGGRGRPKTKWLDEVIGSTKLSLHDLRNAGDDRKGWRRLCHGSHHRSIVI